MDLFGILVNEKHLFVTDEESFVGMQQGVEKVHTWLRWLSAPCEERVPLIILIGLL